MNTCNTCTLRPYARTRRAPSHPLLAPLAHECEVHSALLAPLAQRLHQRCAIKRGHPAYPAASTMAAAVTEARYGGGEDDGDGYKREVSVAERRGRGQGPGSKGARRRGKGRGDCALCGGRLRTDGDDGGAGRDASGACAEQRGD
jgi:hypothetical protein